MLTVPGLLADGELEEEAAGLMHTLCRIVAKYVGGEETLQVESVILDGRDGVGEEVGEDVALDCVFVAIVDVIVPRGVAETGEPDPYESRAGGRVVVSVTRLQQVESGIF